MPDYSDLPYRSSALPAGISVERAPSEDEAHYSTLVSVKRRLAVSITDLYKDFNAFEMVKGESKKSAGENLLRQIESRQIAYNILKPLFDTISSAVEAVDQKYRS